MIRFFALAVASVMLGLAGCAEQPKVASDPAPSQMETPATPAGPSELFVIELEQDGAVRKVEIALRPDLAPQHVERVKRLASEGFYDNVPFHRVIDGFMAQSGDPTGTGTGGSKYPDLQAEFTPTPFGRGTVGAARATDPNSANSQFFICFGMKCSHLAGQYTVWGEVKSGMEFVDRIKRGAEGSGTVTDPDRIKKAYIVAANN